MNKIYKLIWSKVKNMWVAVAEIAKSHTKSPRSSVIGRTLVAGVLACVLGFGVAGPVWAAGDASKISSSNNNTVTGADVYEWLTKYGLYGASMIGTGSESISSFASIGIGYGARVGALSNNSVGYSVAIGWEALTTGSYSTSIGSDAIAYGYRSVAIGAGAQALTSDAFANENSGKSRAVAIGAGSKALANLSVAIGDNSVAEAGKAWVVSVGANSYSGQLGSFASGYGAKAFGKNGVAMGRQATAGKPADGSLRVDPSSEVLSKNDTEARNAVAIGYLSVANEDNAIALGYKTEATGINAIALGSGVAGNDKDFTTSLTRASGQNSMAFGFNARAASQNSIVFGGNALTGENADSSIAIGYDSQVTGEKSIAIGLGHRVLGNNSGTFGDPNIVNGDNSYVVGNNSTVAENTSNVFVLGNNVNTIGSNTVVLGGSTDSANKLAVTGSNSVVLGVGSDGSQSNVVSVGNSTSKRKVVNVADGASATDAATVGQVRTVSEGNGIVLTETTNTNGSKNESIAVKAGTNVTVDTNGVNVVGNGVVASADTGLISGGTAYSELRPTANGNYIATANTTAQNLGALDSALKTADNTAIKDITASGTTVTFTKGDGTTGTFTTQDNNTEYTAGNGLELIGAEFTAKAGTNVIVDNNGINVAGNGTVADGNTGLVSGGTLFTEGRVSADANYVKANNTIAGNLSALDTAVKTNADAITQINTGLEGKANTSLDNITNDGKAVIKTNAKEAINVKGSGKVTVDKTDVSGVDTYTVGVTVDGAVAEGNTGIVNGGAVYTALQAQKTTIDTALTGKANVALDNVTEAGHNVIKSDAKSAINAIAGTHTTISKTDVDGVDTYAVNVTTDGTVTDGNTGIVTGGTVYTAVNAEKTAREAADTVLQGNIDTEATARGNEDTRLAGLITSEESARIAADTALSEQIGTLSADGNYILKTNDVSQNLGVLDTQVKANADNLADEVTARENADTALSERIATNTNNIATNTTDITNLKDLSNITDAGKTVIKDFAKGSVNVVGSGLASVTKTNVEGVDTYTVGVVADGEVADGNAKLVNGGVVHTAIRNAVSDLNTDVQTALAGKANVALDNVTDAGHAVIKSDAKSALNVVGGNYATVDKTDVNGVDTYTVNVATDGAVVDGNTKLVTGATVYQAIQDAKTDLDNKIANGTAYFSVNSTETPNRDGKGATGVDAMAIGDGASASGNSSAALGDYADAKGLRSIALGNSAGAEKDYGIAIGGLAKAKADGGIALGTSANVTGVNGMALGNNAKAEGTTSYAIGQGANAKGESSVALGTSTEAAVTGVALGHAAKATGESGVALGTATNAGKTAVAIGHGANAGAEAAVALGVNASASQPTSVAIGMGSAATEANTVSFGNGSTKRRLVNIAEGVADNDAVAMSQLKALQESTNDGLNTKANLTLNNINDAGKTVIRDLAKGSVKVVNGAHTTVTEGTDGLAKTYAVNVTTDGEVVENNTGIVTGGTVYSAIQDMIASSDTIDGKANVALDNVTVAGHNVIKTDAKSAVNVTGNSDVTVTKTDVDGVDTYNVAVVKTGTVADGNEGVVTGGTVYDALTAETRPAADGNYIAADHMAGANLTALDTQVKTNADAIAVNTTDITNLKDLSNITDAGQTVVKNLAKGSVNVVGTNKAAVTKTDVNGVDTYTVDVKADAGKANVELDNVAAAGHAVIKMDAKSAINVTGGTNAEVVKTDVNGVDTYTVNVAGNGQVVENDTGLMNGGTVYTELRPTDGNYVRKDATTAANLSALDTKIGTVTNGDFVRSTNTVGQNLNALDEALYDKANWDASNVGRNTVVTDDDYPVGLTDEQKAEYAANLREYNLQSWGQALGAGTVKGGDSRLITGDTLHVEVRPANSGTYVKVDKTTGENLLALDEQLSSVVSGAAAQSTTITTLENEMMNKANIALDNINADGQNVVRNIAKSAVVVADGPNTTVASSTDTDGNVTYRVTANATGSVTDGNTGLVDGGAVYTAIENAKAAMGGDIGGLDADGNYIRKANTVAENLVALDTQVKTNSDGLAAEQMARETADTALGNRIGTLTADGNYIAKDSSVSENLSSLDTAVKSVRDKADSNTADITNLKDLSNITAAGETVIKDLAKGSVKVINGARTTVTEGTNGDIKTFAVNVDANGTVTDGNTGLVTGGTVKSALDALSGSLDTDLAGKANVSLDNVSGAGHAVIKSDAKSAINVVGGQYATVAKTDVNGVNTYTVNVATDGSVADGNRKLVTGGTVYNALQDVWGSVNTSLAGKANTSLDNLDVDGMGRVRDIAKSAVSVVNGMNTTVASETGANGNVVYKVNVSASGSVVSGNAGIMSGGTMYNELRPADGNYVARSNTTAANLTALDAAVKEAMTKAETAQSVTGGNAVVYDTDDRSSVTLGGTDGTAIHNVADGAVTADSKDAVTGGQLYTVKSAVDENTTAIAGLDTRVQDNTTAIDTLRTTVTNGLDGKTDTDLGNLTDAGKDAVRDLAKESVRVADGVNTTVRTTVDGDASVYHVDVAANGRVESGNTGIVTGDAVYEAIRDIEINASDTHYVSINPSEKDDETFANHGASGKDAVAIGAKSYASGDESVAIGHNNDVSGNETYVIGSDIDATGNNSVVLGKGSDGSLDNVVSVGSAGNERRIVHVADGELSADSKDAVNGKQLYEVREKLQNAEGIDVDKWSDALGTGSVAPDDERLVKGSTVYSAIQSMGISLSPDGSTMNVGAANNATVVDFTNSEGNGRVLQGIVTDPGNPNSAANVGYVNAIGQNIVNGVNSGLNRLDTKINKVGAGAAALASLAPMPFDDDQKWSVSAAIGTYHGTQAGAVGVFYKPQDNVMLNIRGAIGNGENMGGAGLSIGLNKGAAKGLSKSSMAKAMNAQANEIVAQKQLIENQQAQLDAQKAEIEELKQMVRSVVASKQVDK